MKKYQTRITALLLLAAFAISSCSVEYRERHRHHEHPVTTERVIIHN